jgi:hypothetical protein
MRSLPAFREENLKSFPAGSLEGVNYIKSISALPGIQKKGEPDRLPFFNFSSESLFNNNPACIDIIIYIADIDYINSVFEI